MPAASFDFTDNFRIEQGVYREQQFVWRTDVGAPVPLVGFTARMQLRKSKPATDVLLELSTANGGIAIDGANGAVTVIFKETDTIGVPWRGGVYDLELTSPDNKTIRFIEGSFEVSAEVTRP